MFSKNFNRAITISLIAVALIVGVASILMLLFWVFKGEGLVEAFAGLITVPFWLLAAKFSNWLDLNLPRTAREIEQEEIKAILSDED